VNGNFGEFYYMFQGAVVWLNRNVLAYKDTGSDEPFNTFKARFTRRFPDVLHFDFTFGGFFFSVICTTEPKVADIEIFDMLLETQGRRHIRELKMQSDSSMFTTSALPFSSDTLHQFLAGNAQLASLQFDGFKIATDTCQVIGQLLHLETLKLDSCELDIQCLVDYLGENAKGLEVIIFNRYTTQHEMENAELNFSSFILPLLNNHQTKFLDTRGLSFESGSNNFSITKDAFEACQSLKSFFFEGDIGIQENELAQFFECIAAAPKLLHLSLNLLGVDSTSVETSKKFLKALCDCRNNTLETVESLGCSIMSRDEDSFGISFHMMTRIGKTWSSSLIVTASDVLMKKLRKVMHKPYDLHARFILHKRPTIIIFFFGWCTITRVTCNTGAEAERASKPRVVQASAK
jgi:hypothetical protein